jgi:dienelactone hydrolase
MEQELQSQVNLRPDSLNGVEEPDGRFHDTRTRVVYLDTSPDPTFATVHLPVADSESATGVLFCPPFGWSEICTHRARRAWATAFAQAGYPALRFDLPGTADSGGDLQSPSRLTAWIEAVVAGSSWLRQEMGVTRVCVVGIGFGGQLAWLAAASGAAIDDFVLWGVPTRGRQLVRELQVAAKVDIDWRVDLGPDDESTPQAAVELEEGALLDESGQVIPKELAASLSAIDLRKVHLQDAAERNVLLFQRTGVKPDEELIDHIRASGLGLTVAPGDEYESLMLYVQKSVVPTDAIEASIAWLAGTDSPGRDAGCVDPVASTDSIEIIEDGIAIRETSTWIDLPAGKIFAVITEPLWAEDSNLCAVFSSGGSDRRIGPNRLWVQTARRWATRGVTSVRVDPVGLGDSAGDERAWDQLHDHYTPVQTERLEELLDALERRGLPRRFVLVGFCSGAYRSFHVALRDSRVVGVFALGLAFFRWTWWAVNIRDSWLSVREPRPRDSAVKLKVIFVLARFLHVLLKLHHTAVVIGQFFSNRGERAIDRLAGRGTELLFVLKPASYAHEQLLMPRRRARLGRLRNVRVKSLPGDDQRFRPLVSQQFVRDAMDESMARLLRKSEAETS